MVSDFRARTSTHLIVASAAGVAGAADGSAGRLLSRVRHAEKLGGAIVLPEW